MPARRLCCVPTGDPGYPTLTEYNLLLQPEVEAASLTLSTSCFSHPNRVQAASPTLPEISRLVQQGRTQHVHNLKYLHPTF